MLTFGLILELEDLRIKSGLKSLLSFDLNQLQSEQIQVIKSTTLIKFDLLSSSGRAHNGIEAQREKKPIADRVRGLVCIRKNGALESNPEKRETRATTRATGSPDVFRGSNDEVNKWRKALKRGEVYSDAHDGLLHIPKSENSDPGIESSEDMLSTQYRSKQVLFFFSGFPGSQKNTDLIWVFLGFHQNIDLIWVFLSF
jgi:hypothetical protein